MNDPHYFAGGNWFERTLRFLNLLEPGHMVLSLSKLTVYLMIALLAWVIVYHTDNLGAVLSAVGGFSASLGHYGYRRYMQGDDDADDYSADELDTDITRGVP